MYRYFSEDFLNKFLTELSDVPEIYTSSYGGEVLGIKFEDLKVFLNICPTKTLSKCYKELDRLCEDLGAMKDSMVSYSKHSIWIWFNFDGKFKGYLADRKIKNKIEHQEREKKRKELFELEYITKQKSIQDGTYGVNSQDVGGVYLLSCGDFYKIGFSKNIKSRLSSIRGSNPVEVELVVKYSPFDKRYQLLEDKLHRRFKDSRHQLEWFRKEFTKEDFIEACIEFCKQKALI